MKKLRILLLCLVLVMVNMTPVCATEETSVLDQIKWQEGPCVSSFGDMAEIQIPEGFIFADGDDTRLLMEAIENIPTGVEVGFISPDTLEWFLVFEYEESGYIKDDEKSSLNAKKMLKSLQDGNAEANKDREERGWETMEITGWHMEPRYNPSTNNLEWATLISSGGDTVINWSTRLLGRNGVMSVTLVTDPEQITGIMAQYESIIAGFTYKAGNTYAEYQNGDKIAKYGLSALVVGGVAAAATKAGLFKYIGKYFIIIIVAIGAFFKGIWKKLFRKREEKPDIWQTEQPTYAITEETTEETAELPIEQKDE